VRSGWAEGMWQRSVAISVLLLCACSEPTQTEPDAAPAVPGPVIDAGFYEFPCFDVGEPTGDATFGAVYREVFCAKGCASVYCHGARGQSGGLNIETVDVAYAQLLDVPAGTQPLDAAEGCKSSGQRRVVPGKPDESLLYLKVSGSSTCGLPMPPPTGAWTPLDAAQRQQIRAWILAGAANDG
jgi:hypothetical protein